MKFGLALLSAMMGIASLQTAAVAAEPGTIRAGTILRRCGEQTCLLITGHRQDATAPVMVASHDVAVQGGHNWRISLPVATVEAWSAPFARTIAVRVGGRDGGEGRARLPIGLLGHVTDLALLDISASR